MDLSLCIGEDRTVKEWEYCTIIVYLPLSF